MSCNYGMQDLAIRFIGPLPQNEASLHISNPPQLLPLMRCAAVSCPQLRTLALGMSAGSFAPSTAEATAEAARDVRHLKTDFEIRRACGFVVINDTGSPFAFHDHSHLWHPREWLL